MSLSWNTFKLFHSPKSLQFLKKIFQKIYEDEVDTSRMSETHETLKIKEDKLHSKNRELSKERDVLLQNFHDLERKIEEIQIELK